MFEIILIISAIKAIHADIAKEEIQFLNELPLEKLIKIKNSLHEFVSTDEGNVTSTTPTYLERFGAQAMAMQAPPVRRHDWEEGAMDKGGSSKINDVFSKSVTTLAFLAFGGYLLCLLVHALRAKQMYYAPATTVQPATFLISAGIKKRPQTQFAAYGRKKRDHRFASSLQQIDLPPEQLFTAMIHLCEGYAKWSERYGYFR